MIGRSLALTVALFTLGAPQTHAEEKADVDTNQKTEGKRVVIEGVDRYRVCEPLFECVRVVLSHRGEKYSPEYLQGISGAAFRVAGICPCAPTCSFAMWTPELPELLGYAVRHETLKSCGVEWEKLGELAKKSEPGKLADEDELGDPDLKKLRHHLIRILTEVKDEIRRGRPVILWHAFTTAEFDVVTGFDETTGELIGRGSYAGNDDEYAKAPQFRTLTAAHVGGWRAAILIGEKKRPFDARKAEVAALQEAVKHAHSAGNHDAIKGGDWVLLEGLSCWDQWIRQFSQPDHKRGAGDAYCYGIYRDTHRAAAGFLREIAPKYPAAQAHLEGAANHFASEADVLKGAEKLLWWNSPEGPDAARDRQAVEVLTKAREEYASGIKAIERALTRIEGIDDTPERETANG